MSCLPDDGFLFSRNTLQQIIQNKKTAVPNIYYPAVCIFITKECPTKNTAYILRTWICLLFQISCPYNETKHSYTLSLLDTVLDSPFGAQKHRQECKVLSLLALWATDAAYILKFPTALQTHVTVFTSHSTALIRMANFTAAGHFLYRHGRSLIAAAFKFFLGPQRRRYRAERTVWKSWITLLQGYQPLLIQNVSADWRLNSLCSRFYRQKCRMSNINRCTIVTTLPPAFHRPPNLRSCKALKPGPTRMGYRWEGLNLWEEKHRMTLTNSRRYDYTQNTVYNSHEERGCRISNNTGGWVVNDGQEYRRPPR